MNSAAAIRPLGTLIVLLAFMLWLPTGGARAHELRPAIVTAQLSGAGHVELRLALNLEALIAGIGPEHATAGSSPKSQVYDQLRNSTPEVLGEAFAPLAKELTQSLVLFFDGSLTDLRLQGAEIPQVGDTDLARTSILLLTGSAPAGSQTMTWSAGRQIGDSVFRVMREGETEPLFSAFLAAGETSEAVPLEGVIRTDFWSNFTRYTVLGFEHILPKGLDHILFIVGLFLLSPSLRPLFWQVTGFTLAHTATLALGVYGLVIVPPTIVEPLIAASIAYVGIENIFTDRLRRWRPTVVFTFGLLHGLGFSGVLREIGLPNDQFVTALVGFNLGVEIGQLTVLAICFLGVGMWFRHRHWYRRAVTMPASAVIAFIATFWFFERIL